jgi:hypothetical protein
MTLKDGVSGIKDFFTLVKDLFVGVLVGALLLWPAGLNDRLKEAGFTKGTFGPLTWQASETAQNVSEAKQDVQDVTGAMENVTADPKYANDPRLKQVLDKLKTSEANITSADSTLKTAVAQQQGTAAPQQASQQPAASGWIMLGRIDENRQKWVTANINVPVGSSYAVSPGQEFQLAETVYLRSESIAGQRAAGAINSVVQSGTKVKVLQVDNQSHALAGGWFVWAQVSVEKSS